MSTIEQITQALNRIAAALEAPKVHGRCGADIKDAIAASQGDRVGPFTERSCCELPAGHDGWHKDQDCGIEWSPLEGS